MTKVRAVFTTFADIASSDARTHSKAPAPAVLRAAGVFDSAEINGQELVSPWRAALVRVCAGKYVQCVHV